MLAFLILRIFSKKVIDTFLKKLPLNSIFQDLFNDKKYVIISKNFSLAYHVLWLISGFLVFFNGKV